MTLNKVIKNFENLISQTNKKSDIKIYQEFINIISNLKKKELSERDIQTIELKLETFDLNFVIKENKKHFKKALKEFKEFLNSEFSLITKGYYTTYGMSIGMCFGVAFGSFTGVSLGISSGLTIGMFLGLIIGRYLDNQAIIQGKVI